jgi:hypothetical protein
MVPASSLSLLIGDCWDSAQFPLFKEDPYNPFASCFNNQFLLFTHYYCLAVTLLFLSSTGLRKYILLCISPPSKRIHIHNGSLTYIITP